MRRRAIENNRVGYLMVSPYIIFFLLFVGYPLMFSLVLVFHKWNIIGPMRFIGFGNFGQLLHDALFWKSLGNTLIFLVIHIPLQIIIALVIANILNQRIAARGFFRAAFFLPVVVSGVVVTILWQQLYSQETGLFNTLLSRIGLPKVPWLISTRLAMPSIAIMATWKNVGLYIVLFLTGLQTIPASLYEVADLDGASEVQKFFHVTIPMLNPTMVMVVILSTLGGFSLFIEPYVMTGGGPMNSTLSCVLYIYKQAFYFNHMGYAATLGFAVALIIMIVVIIQRKLVETEIYT
ncbi:MAG: sugar ABC transporter permease [bacterium (Candidatus Stahlbacteria) CG08_land_8_20_14_0_20_40_26]|nr:MAG: sugar ABC transporter permease [bacterium (Candidatus Stahlbacteria) CG23_combo_of_CG06-09_8_20_14_all_40_9]PIS26871.1 MAG: sugar ABC transporter permease [bacterium (Candidatus Stahlbacteria) CG08_land_8_20_14_0_20_40_26]